MALYDDLTVVLGHVDDTKLPVEFLLLNTCTGENIDAEVFLLGGSKVGDVHINGDRTSGNRPCGHPHHHRLQSRERGSTRHPPDWHRMRSDRIAVPGIRRYSTLYSLRHKHGIRRRYQDQ